MEHFRAAPDAAGLRIFFSPPQMREKAALAFICPLFLASPCFFASEQQAKTKPKELFAQRSVVIVVATLRSLSSVQSLWLSPTFCHFVSSPFTHTALSPRLFP